MADEIRFSTTNPYEYTGKGPLDYKLFPAETVEEVFRRVPRARRYIGMTVFITSEGREYWFEKGTTNAQFVPKGKLLDCGEF